MIRYLLTAGYVIAAPALGQDPVAVEKEVAESVSPNTEGLLPVPDYSGDLLARTKLTGQWSGLRQDWANEGIVVGLDTYTTYQDIVDGGRKEPSETSTNVDYRGQFDLMRMGVMPGALLTVRAQSRWGDTVNGSSGLLLPVNTYAAFPFSSEEDGEVDLALTEFNWTQFLSEDFGLIVGKITTIGTANEFMGGGGGSQFMNFQFMAPSVVAQLAPYSTLAIGALVLPSPTWTVTTLLMNLTDSSTSSGLDDIGDGATWVTTADYRGSLNELPGGGSFGLYYGFDGDFARIGGLNISPGEGVNADRESTAWALSWSGWQYLTTDGEADSVDPRDGKQDLQGLGVFANVGLADENTNPTSWSFALGLSGRGSMPGRDADTWGVGYFYNDLQDLGRVGPGALEDSTSGVEAYYTIAVANSVALTLDAQWAESALARVEDATILGVRLNFSL